MTDKLIAALYVLEARLRYDAPDHIGLADFAILRTGIAELEAALADATHWNERVSVCREHVAEIVDGPCVICQLKTLAALTSAAEAAAALSAVEAHHPPPAEPVSDLSDAEIDAIANDILTDDPVKWWRGFARKLLAIAALTAAKAAQPESVSSFPRGHHLHPDQPPELNYATITTRPAAPGAVDALLRYRPIAMRNGNVRRGWSAGMTTTLPGGDFDEYRDPDPRVWVKLSDVQAALAQPRPEEDERNA